MEEFIEYLTEEEAKVLKNLKETKESRKLEVVQMAEAIQSAHPKNCPRRRAADLQLIPNQGC